MKKDKRKGFTLLEVLGAISIAAILTVVIFVSITNIRDEASEEKIYLNKSSILKAANTFTEEFDKSITWKSNDEETMACVPVEDLINKGYLSKEKIDDYDEYVVKVIKSPELVNTYELMKSVDCKIKDTKVPVIYGDDITLEIKADYNIFNDMIFDGTGSNIVSKTATLDNKPIENTKDLDLGTYIVLYTAIDESNNKSNIFSRNITITDTVNPVVSISQNPDTSNKKWTKDDVVLTGNGSDNGSGISAFMFSTNKNVNKFDINWNNLNSVQYNIVQTKKVQESGKWYFYVKDKAGNISSKEIELFIDKIAPIFVNANGNMYKNYVPTANFTDNESGIKEIKYYISTVSTKPDNTNSMFTTSNKISMKCDTTYYAWAIAIDNVGNISEVVKLDRYFNSCPTYTPTHSSSSSSSNYCDTICQMKKNSESWHDAETEEEKDALHQKNLELKEQLEKENNQNYSYDERKGLYYDENGKPIYTTSGGKKK